MHTNQLIKEKMFAWKCSFIDLQEMNGFKSLDCHILLPFLPPEMHSSVMVGLNFLIVFFSSVIVLNNKRNSSCGMHRGAGWEGALSAVSPASLSAAAAASRPAVGEEGQEAAVAIALMSGALTNVWLVILHFRSLPVAECRENGETPTSFSEKKGVSGAD